jgi:hypothetical protein
MKRMNKHLGAALAVSLLALGTVASAEARGLNRLLVPANTAAVTQQGQGNAGAITQNGTGNQAGIQQFGRNNTGVINQDGSNNTACLVQLGRNLDGSIVQTGDNQSTGVLQTRRGTREISAEFCSVRNGPRGLWVAGMRHLAQRLH